MKKITGSIVAITTPFHEDNSIDFECYKRLINWHIEQGTDAIVAVGTTGESATVTPDEHSELIKVTVETVAGRIPVIAGTGGNSTHEAIELTRYAQQVGADASLQVVPYYNKPTQEGMYQHFKTIAETVDLPVILYNVPGRTVADMQNDTICRLAQVDGIVGVKDATGDMNRGSWLLHDLATKNLSQFQVYSGDDPTAMSYLFLGAKGNISVTANVAPKKMALLCRLAMNGEHKAAIDLNNQLLHLHKYLFCEPNPIPVKWAMARLGLLKNHLRLPLTPLLKTHESAIEYALRIADLLN